jgi:para-aminobenzoate synthetase component I
MPRLLRSPFTRWVDPGAAFVALFGGDTDVVWLDSGPEATSGRSYLGRASSVVTSDDADTDTVLEFLRAELAASAVRGDGDGFALGWVGWIGYETRFETQAIPRNRSSPYPDAAFAFLDRAIEFDHGSGEVTLLALGDDWTGGVGQWRDEVVAALDGASNISGTVTPSRGPVEGHWRDSDAEYLAKVLACQAAIAAGDAYLLCLTTEVSIDVRPDPVATYLALRASSPSHHGALLRIGDLALLSASPEQFLTISPAGAIESRPIKGTRPRGEDADSDALLGAELASSEKERAENLMIVDLMRNDIGRVSRIGSVEVPSLLTVESYAHVHQLVSTIRGQLDDGLVGMDAVVACFPAGSMTGTPKSSATRILDSLEGAPRGIYSGAFGYFGLDGRIDLAMVIRSIVLSPTGATIGAGGGITAMSVPEDELAEVKLKAEALLRVLGSGRTRAGRTSD